MVIMDLIASAGAVYGCVKIDEYGGESLPVYTVFVLVMVLSITNAIMLAVARQFTRDWSFIKYLIFPFSEWSGSIWEFTKKPNIFILCLVLVIARVEVELKIDGCLFSYEFRCYIRYKLRRSLLPLIKLVAVEFSTFAPVCRWFSTRVYSEVFER